MFTKSEFRAGPEAQDAMYVAYKKLEANCTWDIPRVMPRAKAKQKARLSGQKTNVGLFLYLLS